MSVFLEVYVLGFEIRGPKLPQCQILAKCIEKQRPTTFLVVVTNQNDSHIIPLK